MSFLGHHLTMIDYIVWSLWIVWSFALGVLAWMGGSER